MSNEADTCRRYVVPRLVSAGWDNEPHGIAEQHAFTDGRIMVSGSSITRRPGKRADYLLRYTRDYALSVVEANHMLLDKVAWSQPAIKFNVFWFTENGTVRRE